MEPKSHTTVQRFFIQTGDMLLGTKACKGFTQAGAERRSRLMREAKPKLKLRVVEVQPYE